MGQNCDKRHGCNGKGSEGEYWKKNGGKIGGVEGGTVSLSSGGSIQIL